MIVHVIAKPWNRGRVHQTIAQVHIKTKRFIIQPISKHNLLLKRRFMHMIVYGHCGQDGPSAALVVELVNKHDLVLV